MLLCALGRGRLMQLPSWESELLGHQANKSSPRCSQQGLLPEPVTPADGMEGEYFINVMGISASLFGIAMPSAWGGGKGRCEGAVKRTWRSEDSDAEKCAAVRQLQRHEDNNGWTHPRWSELFFPELSLGSKETSNLQDPGRQSRFGWVVVRDREKEVEKEEDSL